MSPRSALAHARTPAQSRQAAADNAHSRAPVVAPPRTGNQARLRQLQAKLTVGSAHDPLEEEADAAADKVMRMADPRISPGAPPRLSRKCDKCEDEEKKDPLQRKAGGDGMAGASAPPIVDAVLASPGRALDPATQQFMGDRFGTDFSSVRVHTGSEAAESAAAVSARAYTVGNKIVFGTGQYDPAGHAGRRLLAHELAHTIQQGDSTTRVQRQPGPDATGQAGPAPGVCEASNFGTLGPMFHKSDAEAKATKLPEKRLRAAADAKDIDMHFYCPHRSSIAMGTLEFGSTAYYIGSGKVRGKDEAWAKVTGQEGYWWGFIGDKAYGQPPEVSPPPAPSGPPLKDILRQDQTVPIKGLAKDQPNYIDHFSGTLNSAPIGADYTFIPKDGPAAQTGISIPKDNFYIDSDPLKGFSFGSNNVYKSRTTAEAVVAALTQQSPDVPVYTYYLLDGIIFPTTLSDTTIPNMMPQIRKKRQQDLEDIHATATLAQSVANTINPVPCTEVEADGSLTVSPTFGNCVLPILLHAAPHVMGGKGPKSAGPGEVPKASEPTSGDRTAGEATGERRSEIADAVATNQVNAKQLAAEVAELRSDAGDPAKVHRPTDPNSPYDAEMAASDGHEFHRDKKTQLWERCSPPPCKTGLKLDAETNKKVDAAVQTKDKPVPAEEDKAPPAARQGSAPMKWDAGQIQGVDQVKVGQTIAVAEIQHPDGTIEKVAACYEKAGWRPEQAERARELGYKPLPASTPGSGMHAEQELAAYAEKVKGKVVHGHWAISRGRGGTSIVCPICEDLTRSWGPPQGGKD